MHNTIIYMYICISCRIKGLTIQIYNARNLEIFPLQSKSALYFLQNHQKKIEISCFFRFFSESGVTFAVEKLLKNCLTR